MKKYLLNPLDIRHSIWVWFGNWLHKLLANGIANELIRCLLSLLILLSSDTKSNQETKKRKNKLKRFNAENGRFSRWLGDSVRRLRCRWNSPPGGISWTPDPVCCQLYLSHHPGRRRYWFFLHRSYCCCCWYTSIFLDKKKLFIFEWENVNFSIDLSIRTGLCWTSVNGLLMMTKLN